MATEEKIDFSVLETELQAAIESDVRYWRENDAKLRAVEQRVATYDEFRNIVKAAHLKPLEKKEIQNHHGNKNIIWNTISTRDKVNSYAPPEQFVTKKEGTQLIPKTGVQFTKQWRNLQPSDRFQFLKCVGVHGIKQLFISEVPVEVFGDILEALSLALPIDAASTVFYIRLLQFLTHTNKFNLNLQFLTSSEISTCKKLMDDLNDCFLNYEEYLRENGITEETLHDLRNKYVK